MTKATVNQNQKPLLILLGAPGSGKGTLSSLLSTHLQIPHISSGDLFRENIRNKTTIGLKVQQNMDLGKLVPDDVVLEMIFLRLLNTDCEKGVVLDGVPRTIEQAERIGEKLEPSYKFHVFYLETEESLLAERICGRLVCSVCSQSYHKSYNPPQGTRCDLCGGDLFQRPDDTIETFTYRLKVYKSQTEPLINYYKQNSERFFTVNGGQEKEKVLEEILSKISK